MFTNFFRTNKIWSFIMVVFRLYVGWEFLHAGYEKISAGGFDATGFLKGAVGKTTGAHAAVQPWWGHFLSGFAIPNASLFNFLVPWGEFLVGLALILGMFTTFAGVMGLVMNFAYLFSGTVSTNAQLALLEIFIVVSGFNAAKIGLDYWIIPIVKVLFNTRVKPHGQTAPQHH